MIYQRTRGRIGGRVMSGLNGQHSGRAGMLSGVAAAIAGMTVNWASSPGNLLPPGFSLTRAGDGTYWDSAGLLQTAATDVARGTYRYPTTAPRSGQWGQLPGTTGSYFSTPDSAASSITGDIDIRVKAALTDWTPSTTYMLLSKSDGAAQSAYLLYINGTGNLLFNYSSNGSNGFVATADAATGISDGATAFVRATYASSTGKVNFYKSDDGTIWTQIGTEQTLAANAIFNSTSPVEVGSYAAGAIPLPGKVYQAQIYNGINGTLAVNFNADDYASGTTWAASTTGETWTVNGSAIIAWPWVFDGTMIEQAATNILVNPYNHTAGSWSVAGTTALVANYYIGLSGSQNMDAAVVTAGGAASQVVYQGSVTRSAVPWVDSVDVKYDSHRWVCLYTFDASLGYKYASFDLLNGVVGALSAGATSGITPLGNGFYRLHISATQSASAGGQAGLILNNTDNAGFDTWAPAGTTRVGFGFFQSELGTAPTSRIDGTRAADIPTAPTSGLLVNAQGFAAMRGRAIASSAANSYLTTYTGTEGVPIYQDINGMAIFDGTGVRNWNAIPPATAPLPGSIFSIATTWGGALCNGAYNGALGTPQTFDGSMNLGTTLRIGDRASGGEAISMVLQSMRLGVQTVNNSRLANPFA